MKATLKSVYKKDIISFIFIIGFIAAFVLARYPFYKYFPVPLPVVADGGSYYEVYKALLNGNATFGTITPGYPLFILAVHFFSEKAIALYFAHSLLAFFSALIFLYYTYKYYNKVLPLVSIALAIFFMQDEKLRFETASFPESLINSFLLLFLAFLIGALNKVHNKKWNILAFSLCAAFLIFLKSSTVFIIPIIVIVALYFFLLKRSREAWQTLAFFIIPLLLFALYNLFTIGAFSIISLDRINKKSPVITDKKILNEQEKNLLIKAAKNFPSWHPVYKIHHEKNLDSLYHSYMLTRWGIYFLKDSISGDLLAHVKFEMNETVNIDSIFFESGKFNEEEQQWFSQNKDSLDGLAARLTTRDFKRTKASFLNFFLNIKRKGPLFYYSEIKLRYENIFITREWARRPFELSGTTEEIKALLMREFYDPPARSMAQFEQTFQTMANDTSFKIYDLINIKILRNLSRNVFWVYLFALIGSAALVLFVFNHQNPHLLFLVVLMLIHLGSAMVYSIWSNPLDRYSHPTEFIPYLICAFAPLLFRKKLF